MAMDAPTGETMSRPGRSPDVHPDDPVMSAVDRNARWIRSSARRRGVEVDRSVDGIAVVDRALDEGWWDGDRQTVATRVGCYVGEVLRRSLDAVWAWDPDVGLHLRVEGRRVSPFHWVQRRMSGGPPIAERVRELTETAGEGGFPSAR